MDFEFKEDEQHFVSLFLLIGGLEGNRCLFDFRPPDLKRKEFNKIRHTVFQKLLDEYGNYCQLHCHEDCTGEAKEVDHLIPLSSNVLNKQLRNMMGQAGKKVPAQSFGSNHTSNFIMACKRCNAYKKHRFPDVEILENIERVRNGIKA